MTAYRDIFAALAYPFEASEVKVLPKAGGQPYVTARTVENRLDDVLGPENWGDDYTPFKDSVVCRLWIRLPEGQVLTKSDAGGYSHTTREEDDAKGGFSDAFKRAAVKFGIARYLYKDGVPPFVMDEADARRRGILLHRVGLASDVGSALAHLGASVACMEPRDPVVDPEFAEATRESLPSPPPAASSVAAPAPIPLGRQPCTGRELCGWLGAKGTETGLDLFGMAMAWAREEGHPNKVTEWPVGLVSECFARMAAELDHRGLVTIPPEARDQMALAARPSDGKGPLTFDPKDRLREPKTALKDLAKRLCAGFLGKDSKPSEVAVMAYIDARAVAHGLPQPKSIRDLRDGRALDALLAALREDERDVARVS